MATALPQEIQSPIINANLALTHSSELEAQGPSLPEVIEAMREDANKSTDPVVQLNFAKYLFEIDTKIERNPEILGQGSEERVQLIRKRLQAEAIKWLKRLAEKSTNTDAMFCLAEFYGKGMYGLPVDHSKAFALYLGASKQNHPGATYRAAVCYEVAAGTKKDNLRAYQFYRKAASLGEPLAMHKLALILLYGKLEQKKNLKEGISWLKRATASASQEHPESLYDLAQCYEKEGGCPVVIPDEAYAFELYSKAAHFGYAPAQYRLGAAYEFGLFGCPIDASLSVRWYCKAAEQGLADAELALSGWYLSGAEGVLRQSDADAYLWARKAAERGHAKAEYSVGHFYEIGVGVSISLDDAKFWLQRSASKGYKRAKQKLKELQSNDKKESKCVIM